MNKVLEKAVAIAKSFPETDQEELGHALLQLAERKRIDDRLDKAESSGEAIPLDQMSRNLDDRIAAHKKNGTAG